LLVDQHANVDIERMHSLAEQSYHDQLHLSADVVGHYMLQIRTCTVRDTLLSMSSVHFAYPTMRLQGLLVSCTLLSSYCYDRNMGLANKHQVHESSQFPCKMTNLAQAATN